MNGLLTENMMWGKQLSWRVWFLMMNGGRKCHTLLISQDLYWDDKVLWHWQTMSSFGIWDVGLYDWEGEVWDL